MEKPYETQIVMMDEDLTQVDPIYPERLLLTAIIMNAVHDLNKKGIKQRQAKDFFLNQNDDHVFSFRSICSHLNIDPSLILEGLGLE